MSPTYSEYLRLEELLKLQTGIDGDEKKLSNDELHFILVHQNLVSSHHHRYQFVI
jgi:tryptophan 2,3-dioxygenase